MINLENIHSLTDFKRNSSNYVEQVRRSKSPLVLTVNGEAAVIVQDALTFQQMLDRLKEVEEELRLMKIETLRREVAVGIEQLNNGDFTEYDEESLPELFEDVKSRGRSRRLSDV